MKIGYVYMITSPSGRIYVGSTNNIIRRWKRYKILDCKGQVKLYRSFIKYGVDNHIFEIVWTGDIVDVLKYECLIGTWYEVLNKGLNSILPKYSDKYNSVSDRTRLKLSIAQKKRGKPSEETKIKMSIAQKGKIMSLESRKKMSNSAKGRMASEESKLKMRASRVGRIMSKETRERLSKSLTGKKKTKKHKNNLSKSMKGRNKGIKFSEEHKFKLSLSLRAAWSRRKGAKLK